MSLDLCSVAIPWEMDLSVLSLTNTIDTPTRLTATPKGRLALNAVLRELL